MKIKIRFLLVVLVAFVFFVQCIDDKVSRDYPRTSATSVMNISKSGAILEAEVTDLGSEPIDEHGFVWSTEKKPDILYDNRIYLGPFSGAGKFKAEINTTLNEGEVYYVCAFLKSGDYVVYGEVVKFKSLGSQAPVVTGFSPKSAGWGDTVCVSGKNFSWTNGYNVVYIGDIKATKVFPQTDSTLNFILPSSIKKDKNAISVEIVGNKATYTSDSLRFLKPEVHDFFPKKAKWGDTISIYGKYIKDLNFSSDNGISFGSVETIKTYGYEDTVTKFMVPYDLTTLSSNISVRINGFTLNFNTPFTLLPPVISGISPASGTWGTVVTLTGRFNANLSMNNILFNNVMTSAKSCTNKVLTVAVPYSATGYANMICLSSGPFKVEAPDTFYLKKPEIKYFTPTSGCNGTRVKIGGKYFKPVNTSVFFGSTLATLASVNDSVIYCYLPSLTSGDYKVKVKVGSSVVESTNYFKVTNPKITGISPTLVSYNDLVTVTGENFRTDMTWELGSTMTMTSVTDTKATFKVPYSLLYTPLKISATFSLNDVTTTCTSDDYLSLKDFKVNSITPLSGKPGDVLTITGENLNPNYLSVNIGGVNASVSKVTSTSASVTVPGLATAEYPVKVVQSTKSIDYPQNFLCESAWTRLPDLPFEYKGCTFDFGEEVYIATKDISDTEGNIYKFNNLTKSFNKTGVTYESQITNPCTGTLDGKGYIIGPKADKTMGFEMFDPVASLWITLPDYPGNYGTSLVIFADDSVIYSGGGKYIDGGFYNYNKNFYKYSPKTEKWTKMVDIPTSAYGQIAENRRLLVSNYYYVYEYFPNTNTWVKTDINPQRASYNSYIRFNILFNGTCYQADGIIYFKDGERHLEGLMTGYYNQDANSWVTIRPGPVDYLAYPMVFTVGDYLFVGGDFSLNVTDFYMYDPSKE